MLESMLSAFHGGTRSSSNQIYEMGGTTELTVGPSTNGEHDENPDNMTPVCVLNHCYFTFLFTWINSIS